MLAQLVHDIREVWTCHRQILKSASKATILRGVIIWISRVFHGSRDRNRCGKRLTICHPNTPQNITHVAALRIIMSSQQAHQACELSQCQKKLEAPKSWILKAAKSFAMRVEINTKSLPMTSISSTQTSKYTFVDPCEQIKKRDIRFRRAKANRNKKIMEPRKPSTRSLLQTIFRPLQEGDMIRKILINVTRRLTHVNCSCNVAIQKNIMHIQLMNGQDGRQRQRRNKHTVVGLTTGLNVSKKSYPATWTKLRYQ